MSTDQLTGLQLAVRLLAQIGDNDSDGYEGVGSMTADTEPCLHWYCFTYIDSSNGGYSSAYSCAYIGYQVAGVTMAMINENKRNAGVSDSAVLLSVSHLGCMTKTEFTGAQA